MSNSSWDSYLFDCQYNVPPNVLLRQLVSYGIKEDLVREYLDESKKLYGEPSPDLVRRMNEAILEHVKAEHNH